MPSEISGPVDFELTRVFVLYAKGRKKYVSKLLYLFKTSWNFTTLIFSLCLLPGYIQMYFRLVFIYESYQTAPKGAYCSKHILLDFKIIWYK